MSALSLAAALVRAHEGCRLEAYPDPGNGTWTIGFGHTGADVHQGLVWTQSQAGARLEADLALADQAVRTLARRPLSDAQTAALISFAFNLGGGTLARSTLLALTNEGHFLDAAKEFIRYDHAGGMESKGLLLRRLDEAVLFLKGS